MRGKQASLFIAGLSANITLTPLIIQHRRASRPRHVPTPYMASACRQGGGGGGGGGGGRGGRLGDTARGEMLTNLAGRRLAALEARHSSGVASPDTPFCRYRGEGGYLPLGHLPATRDLAAGLAELFGVAHARASTYTHAPRRARTCIHQTHTHVSPPPPPPPPLHHPSTDTRWHKHLHFACLPSLTASLA